MTQIVEDGRSDASAVAAAKTGYLSAVPILGVAAAFASSVMDMAEPLAPFTRYAFFASAAAFIVLLALFAIPQLRRAVAGLMVFAFLLAAFSGAMWAWQRHQGGGETPERGAIASAFPALAELQDNVGLIEKNTAVIAANTARTADASERSADATERSADTLDRVADTSARTVEALDDINDGLDGVRRLGGIIDDPQSVTDFINNAGVYEARGDTLNARKMFERAIAQGAPFVDVHERYAAILKSQEGLVGAREIAADIAADHPDDPAAQLSAIALSPRARRKDRLDALQTQFPEFGPLFYERTKLMDAMDFTAAEQARNAAAWADAKAACEAGHMAKWYLNNAFSDAVCASAVAMAEQRAFVERVQGGPQQPVTARTRYLIDEWLFEIFISDGAKRIWMQGKDDADFAEVEINPLFVNDYGRGPLANAHQVRLEGGTPPTTFAVRYEDARGEIQGPFTVAFDPERYLLDEAKTAINGSADFWVFSGVYRNQFEISLQSIVDYYCALEAVDYGLDTETPDTAFPLPATCDPGSPEDLPEGWSSDIVTQSSADFVSLQVTYKDGEKTPVRIYELAYAREHDRRR